MSNKRRRFTTEFKLEAINLVLEHSRKVTEVSATLGIGKSTLQTWLRQYRLEQQGITPEKGKALTEEQREIQRLKKENQRLKLERDILKKASALLAQDNLNAFR